MTFPFASGTAVGLRRGVARQYGVDGDRVAWVNGLLVVRFTFIGALLDGPPRDN